MNLLKNLKLGYKLIGGFIIMAAIVAVTGVFGILNIEGVGTRVIDMMRTTAALEKAVLQMEIHQKACRVTLVEGALVRSDLQQFQKYVETYNKKRDLFKKSLNLVLAGDRKIGLAPAQKGSKLESAAKAVLASWGEFEQVADEFIAHKTSLLKGLTPGAIDQAAMRSLADEKLHQLATKRIMEASENAKLDIDDLADYVESLMFSAVKESMRLRKTAIATFVSVTFGAVVLAIVLGLLITRSIVLRLARIGTALDKGAEGNLAVTVRVDSGDELGMLGNDFNVMTEKLAGMLGKVNRSTEELNAIASAISEASGRVVEAAHVQALGLNTTSSAVMQINVTLKGVATDVDTLSVHADESSSSMLEMAASIEEVAGNVETLAQSVDEVSSSIVEMANSIKEVGDSVLTLMDASAVTATSVMQMDGSIKQVGQNAMETAVLSKGVQTDAETGKQAVEATIAGIHEIKSASRITFEVVENLSSRAGDIGAILSVIDEVAEQTNLLALNAAIIAAQAGEHGKGFAVVAEEIKDLAERTTNSTREIAAVIKGVQDETGRAVRAIKKAEASIAEGEQLSHRSGDALAKIVAGAQQSTDRVDQIARAAAEQARGSQMIRDSMERISSMVSQIARATHEQRQGSELIMTAAEKMKGLTGQVLLSTREQSKVGNFVAKSTENITEMIQQIRRACGEQSRGSEQIVAAVEEIQMSSSVNVDVANVMETAVSRLSGQVALLHSELGNFVVDAQAEEEKVSSPVFNAASLLAQTQAG
ncbi:MAG TPA: methyl-accepting chemotaxis protein [Geobacteraceae bacterium]